MRRRSLAFGACAAAVGGLLAPGSLLGGAQAFTPVAPVARQAEAVVLTGAQLPTWSRLSTQGTALPWPSGALDGVRDAHHGTLVVPPDARTGVDPGHVTAYKWDGGWREIRVQVDERFPYFLANANSDFAMYSAVDEELTYAWDDENWKKTAGTCSAAYEPGDGPTPDPVPTLDDDDEIVFMASDAAGKAPAATRPPGTVGDRQEVALADPLDPANVRYVYLFLNPAGPTFTAANGYVDYDRDANADQWIDRGSFTADDPEKLGTSNTGYGPNLAGTVCDPDGTVRASTDRFPRDGVQVSTNQYKWYASGRWMVRSMKVRKTVGGFGPDLIDRWKGRAFQQSPDSSISVVGFEDEQVNWEANSALLGERVGPVRAIREVWGADSGTNVTKTETFYRNGITYRYHLRVHPIPPDGIYTSWDYNANVATRYYNSLKPGGVVIDGVNDDIGNVDTIGGQPAFFDANDPTFNLPTAILNWEQVSGTGDAGSLVYLIEVKHPTSFENPTVVPYYRDDKCLDDGTGDNPVVRPYPGDRGDDPNVQNGYSALNGGVPYASLTCDQKQGAWGSHGVHFFFTGDTDNAFTPKPVTEVDAVQYQFAVPTAAPASVGDPYANTVKFRLVPAATPQDAGP